MITSKLGVVVTCEIEMSESKRYNVPKFDIDVKVNRGNGGFIGNLCGCGPSVGIPVFVLQGPGTDASVSRSSKLLTKVSFLAVDQKSRNLKPAIDPRLDD